MELRNKLFNLSKEAFLTNTVTIVTSVWGMGFITKIPKLSEQVAHETPPIELFTPPPPPDEHVWLRHWLYVLKVITFVIGNCINQSALSVLFSIKSRQECAIASSDDSLLVESYTD